MPNHVTTILAIEDMGAKPLSDIRATFINGDGKIDFDVIVPRPACLRDFEPHMGVLSRARAALGLLPDPQKVIGSSLSDLTGRLELSNALRDVSTPASEKELLDIIRAISNYAECGYLYWYDWCNDNWGTKWNCYGQPDDGYPRNATSFEFQTAWAHPEDLLRRISEQNAGVTFSVRFADEDLGTNCGQYALKDGVVFDANIAAHGGDQSSADRCRWTEFAFRTIFGPDEDPKSHGYDENWEYSDDVYEAYEAAQRA